MVTDFRRLTANGWRILPRISSATYHSGTGSLPLVLVPWIMHFVLVWCLRC